MIGTPRWAGSRPQSPPPRTAVPPASVPASNEQDTPCYPMAAGHLCKARIRQYRLLEYLSFIRFAELPAPTLARRRDSRAQVMTKTMTKGMT